MNLNCRHIAKRHLAAEFFFYHHEFIWKIVDFFWRYNLGMSFFRSGNTGTPPPQNPHYSRISPSPGEVEYRSARRPMAPPQYPAQGAYNDPSSSLFEKPAYSRKPAPPRSGGSCVLMAHIILSVWLTGWKFWHCCCPFRSIRFDQLFGSSPLGFSGRDTCACQ